MCVRVSFMCCLRYCVCVCCCMRVFCINMVCVCCMLLYVTYMHVFRVYVCGFAFVSYMMCCVCVVVACVCFVLIWCAYVGGGIMLQTHFVFGVCCVCVVVCIHVLLLL